MLPKTYDPKFVEEKLSALWQKEGLFKQRADKTKKTFAVVIPPPNITGVLHMGHALNNTVQDFFVRFNRMAGLASYWVPGTDHGGIATQNVIEKKLSAERKIKRQDLTREEFIAECWSWRKECGDAILTQLNKLGCALDLSPDNVRFTMDEPRARAVFEAFSRLWSKRHIYRGKRMINWCTRCFTALSDAEVEREETSSSLWFVHYPLPGGGQGIIVATTRPETMFADEAVAVNPDDERYKHIIGKKVVLPLSGKLIPVIADSAVDKSFGTGALKITPAHDAVDNEIGARHNLPMAQCISPEGRIINAPDKYNGLERFQARKIVAADLKEQGFLVKEEPHKNAVGTCYRCNQPIEPFLSEQWFVNMKELAGNALKAIEGEKVKFHPVSWKKPVLSWLENIQDWCISRQIWWGHRIPVWYCVKCSKNALAFKKNKNGVEELSAVSFEKGAKPILSFEKPAECPHCGDSDLLQDPDVLDTWFSSALWPFSVFGWPENTEELKMYYPTALLSTGYEIIYLWVARMIMMGLEFAGDIPFRDVYLHGIIRDKKGKKMSKSLGNVINPLDIMAQYGTDAMRFSLAAQAFPGKDIPFAPESVIGGRNFCNKIYNASRFALMNIPHSAKNYEIPEKLTELADRWILHRLNETIKDARQAVVDFDIAKNADVLYKFFWNDFCDWYLELAKPRLQTDGQDKDTAIAVLVHALYASLKALHPIMPYITEDVAEAVKPYLAGTEKFLINEPYPQYNEKFTDRTAQKEMELVQGAVVTLRTMRSLFNVPPGLKVKAVISAKDKSAIEILSCWQPYIGLLVKAENVEIGADKAKPKHSATGVFGEISFYIPLEGLIDFEKEKTRLQREIDKLKKEEKSATERLEMSSFKNNAPKEEIERVKDKLTSAKIAIERLTASLQDIGG